MGAVQGRGRPEAEATGAAEAGHLVGAGHAQAGGAPPSDGGSPTSAEPALDRVTPGSTTPDEMPPVADPSAGRAASEQALPRSTAAESTASGPGVGADAAERTPVAADAGSAAPAHAAPAPSVAPAAGPGRSALPPQPVPATGEPYAQAPQAAGGYPPAPYPPGPYAPGAYPPGPYPPGPQGYGPHQTGPYPPGPYPAHGAPPPPPAPRRGLRDWGAPAAPRTHRWGLGAYLLAEAVFLVTFGLVTLGRWLLVGDAPLTAGALTVALVVPTVLAAATALLITKVRGNGPRIDLRLEWSWHDVGLGLAFGLGGLALTIPASLVYVAVVGEDATSAVGDLFSEIRAGPLLAAMVLLSVVIIAPACEEILYRGLLWGGVERLGGRWTAFGVTTLLFALAHFEFTRTPLLLVVAIPIALARLYTGRLLASIVAHQINNLLPGVMLMLGILGVLPMA